MITEQNSITLARVRALTDSGMAQQIRQGARLSLAEVANDVGVSVPTIWRWEHGHRRPTGEAALRYGEVLEQLVHR
ncbi:MAG: helix-turn-helix transcriptional regulator [Acidobacteria bacterium]|nr:helix-turn-helix transcriptional regulator [Acidobacteriota bacterium]